MSVKTAAGRRLVLHLDINKTLLVDDPAASRDVSQILAGVIAANVYGIADASTKSWTLLDCVLRVLPPELPADRPLPTGARVMSYTSFLETLCFPYSAAPPHFTHEQRDAVRAFNQAQRARVRELLDTFLHPGRPGAPLAPLHAALVRHCPEGVVPGYFSLLDRLSSGRVRDVSAFLVCFRTFGADGPRAAAAHNAWVRARGGDGEGAHAGMSELAVRFPEGTARVLRTGPTSRDVHVCVCERVSVGEGDGAVPVCSLITGYAALHAWLLRHVPCPSLHAPVPGAALLLLDHWQYWHAAGETADAGKIVTVGDEPDVVHVFIDDNVGCDAERIRLLTHAHVTALAHTHSHADAELTAALELAFPRSSLNEPASDVGVRAFEPYDAGIVDVRESRSGDSVGHPAARHSNGRVVTLRVDVLSLIMNPDYLTQLVELALDVHERRGA